MKFVFVISVISQLFIATRSASAFPRFALNNTATNNDNDELICDEESGLCSVHGHDPKDLLNAFPNILSPELQPPENIEILCPFLRMAERQGVLDSIIITPQQTDDALVAYGSSLTSRSAYAVIHRSISGAQRIPPSSVSTISWPEVDLTALSQASYVTHECAFSWNNDGTYLATEEYRNLTMALVKKRANEEGRLMSFSDIVDARNEICDELQGGEERPSTIHTMELNAAWNFLGGARGYVEYSDWERFFFGLMPMTYGDFTFLIRDLL
mmetsp:Transcript_17905/g.27385  ORF Transcript_17905/g.27385 Transcript_17905/m.27385 type:complete len:270 (-) Transcript_17905:158-967(-)